MTEVAVQPGMVLPVVAKHDTYGISFDYRPEINDDKLPVDTAYESSDGIKPRGVMAIAMSQSEGGDGISPTAMHDAADASSSDSSSNTGIELGLVPVPTGIPLKVRAQGIAL